VFQFNSSVTRVTIPDTVTGIDEDAFGVCGSLVTVTIADSVTSIGVGAFNNCSRLVGVTIPNTITSVEANTFASCSSLINVTIGNGVTNLGAGAFSSCTALTNFTIPNSVISIGQAVFAQCFSLASVTIPSSVTSIGDVAFRDTGLTNITLPNSVTSIGAAAFQECFSLLSATVPGSVTSIADYTFRFCPSLTGVHFQGNAPSIGAFVFDGDNTTTVYYLPGTTGWSQTFGGRPTAPWSLPYPLILQNGPNFGVQTNQLGFIISWAHNNSVVVEACTDLASRTWSPVGTNTLTDGWSYFSDPAWANYPARFYRLRSP
jgi:hypothetical protein